MAGLLSALKALLSSPRHCSPRQKASRFRRRNSFHSTLIFACYIYLHLYLHFLFHCYLFSLCYYLLLIKFAVSRLFVGKVYIFHSIVVDFYSIRNSTISLYEFSNWFFTHIHASNIIFSNLLGFIHRFQWILAFVWIKFINQIPFEHISSFFTFGQNEGIIIIIIRERRRSRITFCCHFLIEFIIK